MYGVHVHCHVLADHVTIFGTSEFTLIGRIVYRITLKMCQNCPKLLCFGCLRSSSRAEKA